MKMWAPACNALQLWQVSIVQGIGKKACNEQDMLAPHGRYAALLRGFIAACKITHFQ
jgi:hypothetical protein